MDGIHDLGGLDGFGPVEVEPDEPVFHEDWERRMFRLSRRPGRPAVLRRSVAAQHRADGPGALPHVVVLRALADGHLDADRRGRLGVRRRARPSRRRSVPAVASRPGMVRRRRSRIGPTLASPSATAFASANGIHPVTRVRRGTCRASAASSCGSTVPTACPTSRRTAPIACRTDLLGALHGT